MDQPIYWGLLLATASVLVGARLAARRPLWRSHSSAIPTGDLVVTVTAAAILAFHCAAMFFADWVDAVPFAEARQPPYATSTASPARCPTGCLPWR